MNNKKKYSLAACLLHSRLEMVRADIAVHTGKMEWEKYPSSHSILFENSWVIRRAIESIKRDFDIDVTLKDQHAAAELFIISSQSQPRNELERYKVVKFDPSKNVWVDLTEMPGKKFIGVEFSFRDACSIYSYVSSDKNSSFWIVKV